MYIFKDLFTGRRLSSFQLAPNACTDDELCADTYPMKVAGGVILEFTGKYEVRKEGEVQLAGANASAEGEDQEDGGSEENVRHIFAHAQQCNGCSGGAWHRHRAQSPIGRYDVGVR
jgi:hypothetical protein